MGDRSGGRESKGTSLKKSKNNPGASAARVKTAVKIANSGPIYSMLTPLLGSGLYFDCGAALQSRQFDRDRDRVVNRAKAEDCCGMLLWFADIEKQILVADYCKNFSGICYFSTGVHPDNIDRTNKKSHDVWFNRVKELAIRPECVGILSGLNLSRDVATHFAQESMLKSSCALAEQLMLPLILHISDSVSLLRAIDLLQGENWILNRDSLTAAPNWKNKVVMLHDALTCCESNLNYFQSAIGANFYFLIAATGLTDNSEQMAVAKSQAVECLRILPRDRILLCSDSPWKTPQNIPDAYLRLQRNEPSNLPNIALAVSEALDIPVAVLATTLRVNTLRAFNLSTATSSLSDDENNSRCINSDRADNVDGKVNADNFATEINITATPAINDEVSYFKTETIALKATNDHLTLQEHNNSIISATSSAYYACMRCRCRLFLLSEIKKHGSLLPNNRQCSTNNLSLTKTVFKIGEEGLCSSTIFLSCNTFDKSSSSNVSNSDAIANNVLIRGSNLECVGCRSKLGKYCSVQTTCGCGTVMEGPVMKVMTAKVDYCCEGAVAAITICNNVTSAAASESCATTAQIIPILQELTLRAKVENENAQLQHAAIEATTTAAEEDYNMNKKRDKKKKLKSDNKGNFSSYRNKSFIPGASRTATATPKMESQHQDGININSRGKRSNKKHDELLLKIINDADMNSDDDSYSND